MPQPFVKLYFEVKVDGKTVLRRRLSRSFVKGFTQAIYAAMGGGSQTVLLTSGSNGSYAQTSALSSLAPAGTSTYGIQAGTGTTAVTVADNVLATQIANGTGAGQLTHGATTLLNLSLSSSPATFQLQRVFTNGSGGSITVNEIGIVVSVTAGLLMIARDVIAGGVAVGNGQTLTVTYTWSAAI